MEEFNVRMEKKFEKRWEGLGLSRQPPTMVEDEPPPPPIKKVSTKGSCSAIDIYWEMTLAQLANASYMLSVIL